MKYLKRHSGFTLIELLVVVAIIVLITSVAVPIMVRGGLFSSTTTTAAAADVFAQLRGAQTYATTNNVDTAIAYGVAMPDGLLPFDSVYDTGSNGPIDAVDPAYDDHAAELVNSLYGATYNPQAAVLSSSILVRRITLDELQEVDNDVDNVPLAQYIINEFNATHHEYNLNTMTFDDTREVFVPVENSFGQFQDLPNDTCLLTNHFSMLEHPTDGERMTQNGGFSGIDIIRVERDVNTGTGRANFVVTRILPTVNDTDIADASTAAELERGLPGTLNTQWKNQFPAHVFSSSGGLLAATTKQRIEFSVGVFPNEDFTDRFLFDEGTGYIELDADNNLISLDTDINIFVPTGRVKVVDDAL